MHQDDEDICPDDNLVRYEPVYILMAMQVRLDGELFEKIGLDLLVHGISTRSDPAGPYPEQYNPGGFLQRKIQFRV
ncbi:hypothetical protein EYZ11_000828 [Aspergillus tanneri]|uniref:Uncharacterized protein n=1 Tax=Aspergillus tanneri TaxID=1220188 RepID=A0A4S3JW67_9EURO|nr:hypothetical protein EYZ11_000828 [Aspergillus tanneri]